MKANEMPVTWKATTVSAGKGRAAARHWVRSSDGQRVGWFRSFDDAQTEADKRNGVDPVARTQCDVCKGSGAA